MIQLEIILKLSGFCNFRCAYCYEFDRLGDPTRMTTGLVARIASQLGDFSRSLARDSRTQVALTFVLHGGEPLILPLAYLDEVMSLLRTAQGPDVTIQLAVQTNAYRIRPAVMELLKRHDVATSVSHDVIVGSRITAAGQPVETQVDVTLRALANEGLLSGGITVLNRTNAPHLARVHGYWRGLGADYRLLPLFKNGGPQAETYGLSEVQAADALAGLCAHLLDTGAAIEMSPLRETALIALLHIAGLATGNVGRLWFGRTAFVVNTDGGLFDQAATDYGGERRFGNLAHDHFETIVSGPAIRRLHAQDDALEKSRCRDCSFSAACSRWPLLITATDGPRCGVTHHLVGRLADLFGSRGIGREEARALLGMESLPGSLSAVEQTPISKPDQAKLQTRNTLA